MSEAKGDSGGRTWLRRTALAAAGVAVLYMTGAAAHDIARGESDMTAEWSFVIFGCLLAACTAIGWLLGRARRTDGR